MDCVEQSKGNYIIRRSLDATKRSGISSAWRDDWRESANIIGLQNNITCPDSLNDKAVERVARALTAYRIVHKTTYKANRTCIK